MTTSTTPRRSTRRILPAVGALAASMVLFTACSGGMEEGGTEEPEPTSIEQSEGMASDGGGMASDNPMLTTLTDAVTGELNPDVDLASTLDSDEFTVFAPVDEAFAELPEEDLTALAEDSEALISVLTYHVVPGQVAPDEIAGTHTTVQGEDVEVTGEGDELMVGEASVICGGVQTQNATVYLIDSVLMPPSTTEEG